MLTCFVDAKMTESGQKKCNLGYLTGTRNKFSLKNSQMIGYLF